MCFGYLECLFGHLPRLNYECEIKCLQQEHEGYMINLTAYIYGGNPKGLDL